MTLRELLLEKVSKQDISQALTNPNVYVGAEFEFKVPPFIDKYEKQVDMFDKMQDMAIEQEEYDDKLEAWTSIDNNTEPLPNLPEWAVEAGYEIGDEIPPPDEVYPNLKIDKDQLFRKLIKDFLNLETLPFKNMIITHDHNVKSAKKWVIKPDGSLGLHGLEIVSPILPLKEFLEICPKVFEYINNMGPAAEIDDACGFHISMSLKNVPNLGEAIDITKLSLFMDEGYIYNFFAAREFNTYARSAHDTVNRSLIRLNAPKLATKLIDVTGLKKEYPADHYMAINIEHLNSANEYIEFRYIGAENYHRKWDRIKSIMAHYVFDLSLACDPTYKKKEYEHKMARLMNKIELFTVVVRMTEIWTEKMWDHDVWGYDDIQKEWKALWSSWNALKIYKEAVDADIDTEHGRKGFLRMCAMLDVKETDIVWDWSKIKTLPVSKKK